MSVQNDGVGRVKQVGFGDVGQGQIQQQQDNGGGVKLQTGRSPFGGNELVRTASVVGFKHDLSGAGVFDRLGSITQAWITKILDTAEDPKVMLNDAKREMEDTLPKLNGLVQRAEGQLTIARRLRDECKATIESARADAKQFKTDGKIDLATAIVRETIVPKEAELVGLEAAVTKAEGNAAKASQTRDAVGAAIKEKIEKARAAIETSKSDHLKSDITDALQSFERYTGKAAKFDEALAKVDESSAMADAGLADAMQRSGANTAHQIRTAKADKAVGDVLSSL